LVHQLSTTRPPNPGVIVRRATSWASGQRPAAGRAGRGRRCWAWFRSARVRAAAEQRSGASRPLAGAWRTGFRQPRRFPQFGNFRLWYGNGLGEYDGANFDIRARLTTRLTLQGFYTLSKITGKCWLALTSYDW